MTSVNQQRPAGDRPLRFNVGVVDSVPKLVAKELLKPALGLEPPVGVIEFDVADGGSVRLELGHPVMEVAPGEVEGGAPPSARYVRLDGQIVTTTAALGEHLERPAEAWRSLDWVASEAFDVDRIVVADESGLLELRREDGDWLRDDERIAFGPASDLLYEITGARASRILATDPAELGEATVELILGSGDGASETAWLYQASDEGTAARVSDREVVLLLAPETATGLSAAIEAVRQAGPAPVESEDA